MEAGARDGDDERKDEEVRVDEPGSVSLARVMEGVVHQCYNDIAASLVDVKMRKTGEQKEEFIKAIRACKRKLMKLHVCVEWLRKRVRALWCDLSLRLQFGWLMFERIRIYMCLCLCIDDHRVHAFAMMQVLLPEFVFCRDMICSRK